MLIRRAGRSREKTNFSNPINAIPSVQSPVPEIFRFAIAPNHIDKYRIPSHSEGRFAIVTNVGCGMRWTQGRRETGAADADGEVVWSRRSEAGVKSAEAGGLVVTRSRAFFVAREAAGASGTRHSPRPPGLDIRAKRTARLRAHRAARPWRCVQNCPKLSPYGRSRRKLPFDDGLRPCRSLPNVTFSCSRGGGIERAAMRPIGAITRTKGVET
jgi:hypothetical protein